MDLEDSNFAFLQDHVDDDGEDNSWWPITTSSSSLNDTKVAVLAEAIPVNEDEGNKKEVRGTERINDKGSRGEKKRSSSSSRRGKDYANNAKRQNTNTKAEEDGTPPERQLGEQPGSIIQELKSQVERYRVEYTRSEERRTKYKIEYQKLQTNVTKLEETLGANGIEIKKLSNDNKNLTTENQKLKEDLGKMKKGEELGNKKIEQMETTIEELTNEKKKLVNEYIYRKGEAKLDTLTMVVREKEKLQTKIDSMKEFEDVLLRKLDEFETGAWPSNDLETTTDRTNEQLSKYDDLIAKKVSEMKQQAPTHDLQLQLVWMEEKHQIELSKQAAIISQLRDELDQLQTKLLQQQGEGNSNNVDATTKIPPISTTNHEEKEVDGAGRKASTSTKPSSGATGLDKNQQGDSTNRVEPNVPLNSANATNDTTFPVQYRPIDFATNSRVKTAIEDLSYEFDHLFRYNRRTKKDQLGHAMISQIKSLKTFQHLYAAIELLQKKFAEEFETVSDIEGEVIRVKLWYNEILAEAEKNDGSKNQPLMKQILELSQFKQLGRNIMKLHHAFEDQQFEDQQLAAHHQQHVPPPPPGYYYPYPYPYQFPYNSAFPYPQAPQQQGTLTSTGVDAAALPPSPSVPNQPAYQHQSPHPQAPQQQEGTLASAVDEAAALPPSQSVPNQPAYQHQSPHPHSPQQQEGTLASAVDEVAAHFPLSLLNQPDYQHQSPCPQTPRQLDGASPPAGVDAATLPSSPNQLDSQHQPLYPN